MQRRATKQVPTLKDMNYEDRLRKLKMPTLKYRRIRGDMIEVFKILRGIYDQEVTSNILKLENTTRTRGNDYKLKKMYCRKNIRKFSFSCRITNIWNSLPNEVINAKTVKNFEIALDKHWKHQDIIFNHNAEINTQTGNHNNSRNQPDTSEVDIVANQASAHDSS